MNEENTYNLIDEPWIPVMMQDGTNRSVSLGDVFADADGQIADLALNPYERVSVFRLLLCIAQAAFGPERLKDERAWRATKDAIGPVSSEYLNKWHGRFFLYGPHAFLQPDCIALAKPDGATPCDKLVLELSSGNKSTLFDHDAASGCYRLSDAELALGMITYQNFSSGGLSGQCVWDSVITEKSIQGAPCRERSMLFTIVQGNMLLETVWMNLVTQNMLSDALKTNLGRPFWEFDALVRAEMSGNEETLNGHLAPLSRAIKLTRGNSTCILGEALSYPQIPEWREPMASVKLQKGTKKNEFRETYVSSNPARMPWRELTSILAVRETGGCKSAIALRHLDSLPEEKDFTLWTGGLYSEKAKEIATVEWKVKLSIGLLGKPSLQLYQNAIDLADWQRSSLYFATAEYARVLLVDETSRFSNLAERTYWDILAQPENQKLVLSVDSSTYLDDWKKATRKAAEEAYRHACPAVTARQMEAYAQGFAKLWVSDGKKGKAIGDADFGENEGGDHV